MSATTYSGLQYATTGDPAAIHTVSQNLANTASARIVGSFANAAARDTAYAPDIAAGKVGMMCYCIQEDGHCVYRLGLGWKWLPYYQILTTQTWDGPANVLGPWPTQPGGILLTTNALTLPGTTLRRIRINAGVSFQGWSGGPTLSCGFQVNGAGIVYGLSMGRCQGIGDAYRESIFKAWEFTAQGTQTWTLWGYVFLGGADWAQFSSMSLQVIDMGPA